MPIQADAEAVLLERARGGEAEAFVSLIRQYDRRIYRLAMTMLNNHPDAEDVLQEVVMKAFSHLQGFRGESSFHTWITRITTNECLMRLRRHRGRHYISLDEHDEGEDGSALPRDIEDWRDSPEKLYLKSELEAMVREGMEKLDPKSRAVLLLRDFEQLSAEETAQALEMSVAAVKTRLFRARLHLREHLNAYFTKGQ